MVRPIVFHYVLALLLLLINGVFTSYVAAEESDAVRILTKACDILATTDRFTMLVELNFDVVQDSGQKIEFGGRQEVTIERPNHARIDTLRRDGSHDTIIYNGKKVTLYNELENVYAEEPFSGGLDKVFNFITDELEIPLPLGELLSSNSAEILTQKVKSAKIIGTSVFDTVQVQHLAFRNDDVDFQVWIGDGEKPLPQRLVIHYKNEPGKPKFIAHFISWNTSPHIDSEVFSFTPPEEAERIPIAVVDVSKEMEGGNP